MTVVYFPIRHHSPRASFALAQLLERTRPDRVLVEGPRDAMHLVPYLFDADTTPPVAILAYRTDGPAHSMVYPMATYSPEYVALKWAHDHGVASELIDITAAESLAAERFDGGSGADAPPSEERSELPSEREIALGHGFRSFEELWEAWFEAPAHEPQAFTDAMLAWAQIVRSRERIDYHRARDARMARHIRDARGERIVAVIGAAHAAALVEGDVDPALEAMFDKSVPSELTVIPYSFTRLAGQVGYGAGNRAPRYYQKAHDAGCDYTRATLEVLIEFTEHLRVRGFAASLADTIEAYRLAVTLAQLRDKHAPGLDEVRDATIATMCRGEARHVDEFLWPSVVGKTVGKVGVRIGKNSLQTEFWAEVAARGLPRADDAEEFTLRLADPVQVQTSAFLHRLRIAGVPYATYRGSQATARPGAAPDDEAGGVDALARVREHWMAQWTPATDIALVELVIHGDSLAQVVERILGEALASAGSAAAAAHVVMEAVVAGAPRVVPDALAATERLAARDEDIASLARATRALSGLISYGTSRIASDGVGEVVAALAEKAFARAVLRVEPACTGDDEAVRPAMTAIRILHEIAVGQRRFDTSLWFQVAGALVDSTRIHAACAGVLACLLYLAERLDEPAVTTIVQRRVASIVDPGAGAAFLEGFLGVNALVLVKNRAIVGALDGFLQSIPADRFRDVLPVLRRALAVLGTTERRYLVENLFAVRKVGEAHEAQEMLARKDVEQLEAMSEDIARAMDDLDELL